MDTTDKFITFDQNGLCNHCQLFDFKVSNFGYDPIKSPEKYDEWILKMKNHGKGKKYDCILGLSGGVDSSFLLHKAVLSGLRVLAVHVDAGWNSEIAVKNIQLLCQKLNVNLHTIVIDWKTIKELQRAYMFSGLPNLDVPQDHVFLAAMYKYAIKYKIKYMLNGSNLATEGILPALWGYNALDFVNIKDIFRKHRRVGNLNKYPHFGLFTYYFYTWKIKRINLLNYISYSKKDAIETLKKLYDWKYYGGKHFESRFTKFFQSYYLPIKFGYDKRLAHLSSLIVGGEMSREDALNEYINNQPYNEKTLKEDLDYILKKLDLSNNDWNHIMNLSIKNEDDYKTNKKIKQFIRIFKPLFLKK